MSRRRNLRSEDRRAIRRSLAARDGARCFYCRSAFPALDEATLDHYVPYSLWRTWWQRNLVLACSPCNTAKGNALPLLLALLLLRRVEHSALWRTACVPAPSPMGALS